MKIFEQVLVDWLAADERLRSPQMSVYARRGAGPLAKGSAAAGDSRRLDHILAVGWQRLRLREEAIGVRTTRSATRDRGPELAVPLRFAGSSTPGRFSLVPVDPQSKDAGQEWIYVLGMQYMPMSKGKEQAIPDRLRLEALTTACPRVGGFFATERLLASSEDLAVELPCAGFHPGIFTVDIPFCEELKPSIIMLDYNWFPIAYLESYGKNWFSGKIHEAMHLSQAKAFLMPNARVPGATRKQGAAFIEQLLYGRPSAATGCRWTRPSLGGVEDIPSFDEYNDSAAAKTKLSFFFLSAEEAETMHPLVAATIAAHQELSDLGGRKTWEKNKDGVWEDKAFIVFHPLAATEQSTRTMLASLQCARPAAAGASGSGSGSESESRSFMV